ncbi:MAG: homocysteine S-methyltransferase family protein [Planctomycetaceae bacterium]|nr:homocysteine S-methyltransferase family protein [Planctomycetaceae bacterium]
MAADLLKRLKQGIFWLDGAMGTQLYEAGAPEDCCTDMLNLECAEIVRSVHTKYLAAGIDAVITNSFGANAFALRRHGFTDHGYTISLAAAKLARYAAGDDKYVLGDIGPSGGLLEPLGSVKPHELRDAYLEEVRGLTDGGVDGFIIETMTALEELEIAIDAVKSISRLPVFASLAYDPAGRQARTMMGVSPQQAVERILPKGIAAIGFNCGTLDMDGYVQLASLYAQLLSGTDVLLLAEPNAGRPGFQDNKTVYRLTPEQYAEAMLRIRDAGAAILGGCCGTSPAHIAAAIKASRP